MSITALTSGTAAAETEVLTAEEYKRLCAEAESLTSDDINAITVNPPAMQSAPMVAKQTTAKFMGILKSLKVAYAEAPIDCSTPAGEKAAREIWRKFVTLRTRSDKIRLEHNRVFIEQQKANNDAFEALKDSIIPIEQRYEDAIREKERAVETARKEREEAARQKAAGITQFILDLGSHADNLVGLSSGDIEARIQTVKLIELVEGELEHRFGEAVTIKDRTIDRLEAAHAEKLQAEKDAEQVKIDRERFAREQAERDAREQAERDARNAIGEINDDLALASDLGIDALAEKIATLESVVIEHYAPLQGEARAAVDRVLPAIRKIYDDKVKARAERTAQLEHSARVEKEAGARQRIADMKALVADCVGSSSAAIKLALTHLDGLLMAGFEPFAKEAEEEQGRVRTALEKLRLAAEADERTAAEKQAEENRLAEEARAKAERAASIEGRIAALSSTARRLEADKADSKRINHVISELPAPDEHNYGDRLEEARAIYAEQAQALSVLFNRVHAEEQEAERLAREKHESAQREAAELAQKTRRVQVLTAKSEAMFSLLQALRNDEGYAGISAALRADIDGLTRDIVASL